MNYDSRRDTELHIVRVQGLMFDFMEQLRERALVHDRSKLEQPEKAVFDEYTPKLKNSTYGSDEYKQFLDGMGEGLKHHYAHNSHHPQHYPNGVDGMSLLDVVEMFCDWKAATERHADGSLEKSIELNRSRFVLSDQLAAIFENTRRELNW